MRLKTRRLLLASSLVLATSLLAFLPLAPEKDPAWWLLGGLRPSLASPGDILVLDADPETRLSPGELALDLRSLAEFDAASVLVDLPLDWTQGDTTSLDTLARVRVAVDGELGRVSDNLRSFWLGLRSGSLRAMDAASGFDALEDLVATSKERLLEAASPSSAQLPALEAALRLHPDVWFGLGLRPLPGAPTELEADWAKRAAIRAPDPATTYVGWRLPEIAGIEIPPESILEDSAGSGFSLRDETGSTRAPIFPFERFSPLASYEGSVIPEPALLLLAKRMGAGGVELDGAGIRLLSARVFRGGRRTLLIPLDPQGRAMIGRPERSDSWPRRQALAELGDYRRAESRAVDAIAALEKAGLLVDRDPPTNLWQKAETIGDSLLAFSPPPPPPPPPQQQQQQQQQSPAPALAPAPAPAPEDGSQIIPADPRPSLAAWKGAKEDFYEAALQALSERSRMDELLKGLLSTPDITDTAKAGVQALRDKADEAFTRASAALDDWKTLRQNLTRDLGGALVLIGPASHRSRGGFIPPRGAPPIDPMGDVAAFLRVGLSAAFIATLGPSSLFPIAAGAGLVLSLLLLFLRSRLVLAAGIVAALALLGSAGLALVEAETWWSPTIAVLVVVIPGLVGIVGDAWRERIEAETKRRLREAGLSE